MSSVCKRHLLVIRKVGVTDFGNYSCMAENSLGRERGYIQITGTLERTAVCKICGRV
jgi:hypothetical protein